QSAFLSERPLPGPIVAMSCVARVARISRESRLALDHFRHFEEDLVRLRRLRHQGGAIERRKVLIGAQRACAACSFKLRYLREWLYALCVQLIQLGNIVQD